MSAPKFQVGDWVRWVGLQNPEEDLKLKFSERARRVLTIAQEEARQANINTGMNYFL